MAGDWMKIELELPEKPEVHYIAGALNLPPENVVGHLVKVWAWFNKHTEDGNDLGVTFALVDRLTSVTGFGEAMAFAGWLEQHDKVLHMPKFERHTSESAKKRALTAARQSRSRNAKVTHAALQREEKRRVIKPLAPSGAFERFWEAYPKRRSKDAACKAFAKINPDEQLLAVMLAAIERAKTREDWQREGGQFVPYPATWLNSGGWKDEDTPIAPVAKGAAW